ncbi:MAG: VCBS domain-containing protein, partial [Pseudomonadota bacterium]
DAAFQSLAQGEDQVITVTYDVTDEYGASAAQSATITITGTNDTPTIAGVDTGSVKEDTAVTPAGDLVTGGTLTISDADEGQSSFTAQAGTAGSNGYGTFTLDAGGQWTYTAVNSAAAIQLLNDGQSLTDSFTAWSSDGSESTVVTVTIDGTTEPPTTPPASADGETIIVSSGSVTIDSQWIFGNDTPGTGSIVGFASNPTGFSTGSGTVTINTGSLTGGTALTVGGQAYTAYTIAYQVIDSAGATANATLNLAVVNTSSGNDTINLSTATLADPFFGGDYDYAYLNLANGTDTVNATTGDGIDELIGGPGNDTFYSGAGADTMTGDQGIDTFVFNTALTSVDTITDFNATENASNQDWIQLSSSVFTGISAASGGTLATGDFASIATASGTYGAGVNIVFDQATGNLWYDADGGNLSTGATQFATLGTGYGTTLDAGDFKVV